MSDINMIQIHELNEASSVAATDVLAIDTGNATLKLKASKLTTGVKGNAESSYRTGNVNLTPANIGAVNKVGDTMTGTLTRKVDKDFNTPPSSTEWTQIVPITDDSNGVRGGIYLMRRTDGSYQALYGTYKEGVGWNYIAPRINSDNSFTYDVNHPEALRSAIGAAASSNVSNLIIKRSFTLTTSVSLNSLASTTFEVPYTTPTGYKAVAALEGRVDGGLFAVTVNLRSNGTHCAAYVINAGSGTRTGTGVTVDILFIRDI